MAYIYRYQLRDSALKDRTVLTDHTQIIQSVLDEHFNENLKDSIVEEKYFEFKLYATVSSKSLQRMGHKLKSELPIEIKRYGFVRMEQTLYALVYSPQDNQEADIHIEFIDSILLDNPELYKQRANNFYEKFNSKGSLHKEDYVMDFGGIIKNYYIDILESYYKDKNTFRGFFGSTKEISYFRVKGYHRRYDDGQVDREEYGGNKLFIEKCFDAGYVENRERISEQEDNKSDYLEIHKTEELNNDKFESELSLLLPSAESVYALDNIQKSNMDDRRINYKFRVHNVGQAQATSLALNEEPPFLYFDYGMPYGRNTCTIPPQVNMPTNPGTTIILSHVDKDHWFRIAFDLNAYQCNWFIPDQHRRAQLNHKLAEIIVHGGSVQTIHNEIAFGQGMLTCGGVSEINPSRPPSHVHETGLSLRLEAHDAKGNDLNILIAGDQMYDYIDAAQLRNLDLLVASHHGGAYCWSTHGCVPNPRNSKPSTVIYGYGTGNTYGHPSNTADYAAANWNQAHHTSINGNYEINIAL